PAEDGIRDFHVTGVQTCALPISLVCSASGEEGSVAGAKLEMEGRLRSRAGAAVPPPNSCALTKAGKAVKTAAPSSTTKRRATPQIGRASCRERGKDEGVAQASDR